MSWLLAPLLLVFINVTYLHTHTHSEHDHCSFETTSTSCSLCALILQTSTLVFLQSEKATLIVGSLFPPLLGEKLSWFQSKDIASLLARAPPTPVLPSFSAFDK